MRIALCQLNPTVGAIQSNRHKALKALEEAHAAGADLALFPELFISGYPSQDLLLEPHFITACEEALNILAKNAPLPFVIGLPTRNRAPYGAPGLNSVALVEPQKLNAHTSIQFHHKSLLPNYDIFSEPRYFAPGDSQTTVDFAGMRCALFICEDIWAEEAHEGRIRYPYDPTDNIHTVDLIIAISASPFHRDKAALRNKVLLKLSQKTNTPVAFVNQVGAQDSILFDGGSSFVLPNGTITATSQFEENIVIVGEKSPTHSVSLPRTAELLKACVMGIRDYFKKQGFSKAILGISGGIDSAVVASLAVLALGHENVLGVLLPSRFTSKQSIDDALTLAHQLNIESSIISIEPALEQLHKSLQTVDGVAFENLQARIRGTMLMTISNRDNRLLLATSNKSELAMGFFTLYGDACGALAPLGDLLKREVYELGHYLHETEGWIPQSILMKEPTAELRFEQRDSDSLPPYEILDDLVELFVVKNKTPLDAAEHLGIDHKLAASVYDSIGRCEYKRRQCAPILKVSLKAFGCGRNYPIVRGSFL